MAWVDELLAKFAGDASANRRETIAFASGGNLPDQASARTTKALGSLGVLALVGGGYLLYRWLKKGRA